MLLLLLLLLQTHDSIKWWGGLCSWGADFCSRHKWAWFCGLTLQYCQVISDSAAVGQLFGARAHTTDDGSYRAFIGCIQYRMYLLMLLSNLFCFTFASAAGFVNCPPCLLCCCTCS